MKHNKIVIAFGLMLAVLTAAPAYAQRVYVASQGSDANNCSLQLPCRSLQHALTISNAGGEIAILDTGGYNGGTTVTIDKAISIVNQGGYEAGISFLSSVPGIVINAGPNDAVSLRGLTIEGAGVGRVGIQFNSGASLTVENCIVRHMINDGIDFLSTTATSALTISNSLVADNGFNGVSLEPTGSATAVLNRVETNNNGFQGIYVDGSNSAGTNTVNATVSDSVAAGNGQTGFWNTTQSGQAPTSLMVSHSVAANNSGFGVVAQGSGATLRLANSTVTGNTNGWGTSTSGVVDSYGDNYIDGNAANQSAPPSIARK
jgi:Right handed beta helix region